MPFQPRQPSFLSVRASCKTEWMWMGSLRRLSSPQALQIWTHWTITSGAPCWKSTISSSRSIRQLMSWKSLCRPYGKRCHKNMSTRRWQSSPTAWLPTWLWLPMVVTPSICNDSVSLQVCILISSTNTLALFTATNRRPVKTTLGMLRNGGLSWSKQFCHFWTYFNKTRWMRIYYCLTVV